MRAGSGIGGLGPAGQGSGGRLGPSRPLTAGRGAASRVWGPVGVRARVSAAGPGRLGVSGPFLFGDGDRWGRCRLRAVYWGCSAPWMLFLGPPCLAGTEGGGSRAGLRASRPHELIQATAPGWATRLGGAHSIRVLSTGHPLLAQASSPPSQLWSPWDRSWGLGLGRADRKHTGPGVACELACLHRGGPRMWGQIPLLLIQTKSPAWPGPQGGGGLESGAGAAPPSWHRAGA